MKLAEGLIKSFSGPDLFDTLGIRYEQGSAFDFVKLSKTTNSVRRKFGAKKIGKGRNNIPCEHQVKCE